MGANRQKPAASYIVGFSCAERHLVIEIEGDSHAAQLEHAADRRCFFSSFGLHVWCCAKRDPLSNLPALYDNLATQLSSLNHE